MIDRLVDALVQSKNEAADVVLLEALRVGNEREQRTVLRALLRRKSVRGLSGVIRAYDDLPGALQLTVLQNVKTFYPALRESGRADDRELRLAAMRLIALGRQGKLAYVLSENLHSAEEELSKAATEAMVALARWVSIETRRLQAGESGPLVEADGRDGHDHAEPRTDARALNPLYDAIIDQRPEIEAAVARAMDVHRGRHGQDLLRAALLLCDWSGSKTLAILNTTKHAGQSPMVRRLQQPPASEHVEAFLLGATHGQLRSHFGIAFSHIDEAPVLDALLRKTHWLKDHQLQLCMHQVTRGAWWGDGELKHDIERRSPEEAAKVGEWLAASGVHDVMQDERLETLRVHARDSFDARLRLLRAAMRRKLGSSVQLIQAFLGDPDERLARLAAREIVRRRPGDYESILLQQMTNASDSVRRIISRAIGQAGFEHFWQRFDRLNKPTRRQAGRAMMKILPDAIVRLGRRLTTGPVDQRLKAMQIASELDLAEQLRPELTQLCTDPNPKLRSKAVSVVGTLPQTDTKLLVDRLLHDSDARVRANTIEVLEERKHTAFVPVLAERARAANNRERANAIKALHRLKVGTFGGQLLNMLRDPRSEHRISAMWALRQVGWWQLIGEVGRLAREDDNLRVRRYALTVLRGVAELAQQARTRQQATTAATAEPSKKAG